MIRDFSQLLPPNAYTESDSCDLHAHYEVTWKVCTRMAVGQGFTLAKAAAGHCVATQKLAFVLDLEVLSRAAGRRAAAVETRRSFGG